jgi:hypothetical protein
MSTRHARITASQLALRLGFWSAVTTVLTFVIYTICFIAILLSSPLFTWTGVADYVAYVEAYGGSFRPLAQASMILFSLSFVVLLHTIQEVAPAERKLLARISVSFGSLFAVTVGIHYFAQVSAVRLNVLAGRTEGLEYFVQANPHSMLSAINMLGWSIFLGLASLFVAPIFSVERPQRLIRFAFLLNGLFCLAGGVGYVWDITWLIFVTTTMGMGVAVLVAAAALARWFRRQQSKRV